MFDGIGDPRKLKGGQKQLWLRENRQVVLDYMGKYGRSCTMLRFGIWRGESLDRLIEWEAEDELPVRQSEVRMASSTARASLDLSKDAHIEIRKLKEAHQQFVYEVADRLQDTLFIPMLKVLLHFNSKAFDTEDNLSLEELLGSPQIEAPKPKVIPKRLTAGSSPEKSQHIATFEGNPLLDTVKRVKCSKQHSNQN